MPGKNTSIALGEPFIEFARKKVETGEFGTTSEVVREAMRRYIAEDTKLELLRRELEKGLDSGPARSFDWEALMERKFGTTDDA
ncbi:MAG: type II toxin-antitoxin system ParD family antitoxin [Porphyrobacter sp.]|nr:type II toxin-antitoxin system ParD family antitoxin [Porphyrobacter sp.]